MVNNCDQRDRRNLSNQHLKSSSCKGRQPPTNNIDNCPVFLRQLKDSELRSELANTIESCPEAISLLQHLESWGPPSGNVDKRLEQLFFCAKLHSKLIFPFLSALRWRTVPVYYCSKLQLEFGVDADVVATSGGGGGVRCWRMLSRWTATRWMMCTWQWRRWCS